MPYNCYMQIHFFFQIRQLKKKLPTSILALKRFIIVFSCIEKHHRICKRKSILKSDTDYHCDHIIRYFCDMHTIESILKRLFYYLNKLIAIRRSMLKMLLYLLLIGRAFSRNQNTIDSVCWRNNAS